MTYPYLNHPNDIAYARSQEDHMYDEYYNYNNDYNPTSVRAPDPAFEAVRPILNLLPYRSQDSTGVTDVESLATFLLNHITNHREDEFGLRQTVNDLRRDLTAAREQVRDLTYANQRLTAQIDFAAKYPGETVEDVVLSICKAQGLGTDNFKFIAAIKDVRIRLNNGLKEAKDLVAACQAKHDKHGAIRELTIVNEADAENATAP